ncbi:hypothetical protein FBY31_1170 [Arthrobacter sp. SLBN-100]|nr:hypothetical protein FBY31_1170 [Arthrobacter sp. SLBN-100]
MCSWDTRAGWVVTCASKSKTVLGLCQTLNHSRPKDVSSQALAVCGGLLIQTTR